MTTEVERITFGYTGVSQAAVLYINPPNALSYHSNSLTPSEYPSASRTKITQTEKISKSFITVSVNKDNAFAQSLLKRTLQENIFVYITRGSTNIWAGRVLKTYYTGEDIKIECGTFFEQTKREGLQSTISYFCRFRVYSTQCGLAKASNKFTYSGVTADASVITVSGITEVDDFFNNGIAEMSGQVRGILQQTGTTVILDTAFIGTLTGSIDLYPGCPLTLDACTNKFNTDNHVRFGGFKYIPLKNPFSPRGLL